MVAYKTNELVPSSEFAKKFGSYLLQIKEHSVEKLAVLKNNKIEAVLISKDEYEKMSEALKFIESKELIDSIKSGLKDIENNNTHPIEELWDKLDD